MIVDFKDLIVWQRSMDLVVAIYEASRTFPSDERFGLTNQLRRASISIASNIAEGQGRQVAGDFVRFLRIANGSRQEVETQLLAAERLGFLSSDSLPPLISAIDEIGRLLNGLIRSIN